MSTEVDLPSGLDDEAPDAGTSTFGSLRVVLVCVVAIGALAIAGAVGWLIADRGSGNSIGSGSVDAGFARDMSTHHTQAVQMAGYTRDHTSNSSIELLAFDIETSQYTELGQMQGWLDGWGLTRVSSQPVMSWMAGHSHVESDGLMPGIATPAEIDKLLRLTGKPLDVFFLQLMIRHHQGGLPMAQYAAEHAKEPYVRNLAQKMAQNQSNEIVQMEQLLRQLGGSPLPAPD
ncbi:MAG TPA: DUF305 domain-containing protein [Jatrophihabitantaceae bacterium]|jgi:uncharacterized protein (DUF305 family)